MIEKPKRSEVSQTRGLSFFKTLLEQVKLSWSLFTDSRVPVLLKIIPLVALAYLVSPIDLVPDIFPVLGQLDDLGILMAAVSAFNSMAPADIVAEHISRMRKLPADKVVNVKANPSRKE
jgi:uncharacterized membrane protein YkvA (DUF1232 family)